MSPRISSPMHPSGAGEHLGAGCREGVWGLVMSGSPYMARGGWSLQLQQEVGGGSMEATWDVGWGGGRRGAECY